MAESKDKLDQITLNIGRLFESQVLLHESVSGMKAAYDNKIENLENNVDAPLSSHIRTEDQLLALGQRVERLASSVQLLVE